MSNYCRSVEEIEALKRVLDAFNRAMIAKYVCGLDDLPVNVIKQFDRLAKPLPKEFVERLKRGLLTILK